MITRHAQTAIVSPITAYGDVSWTPAQIPGKTLWLRPQLIDPSDPSVWRDSSGLGNHAVQPNGTKRPIPTTNVARGMSGMLFTGAQEMVIDSALAAGEATLIAVLALSETTSAYKGVVCLGQDTSSGIGLVKDGSGNRAIIANGVDILAAGHSTTAVECWIATLSNASKVWKFYLGGVQTATTTGKSFIPPVAKSVIGDLGINSGYNLRGYLFEAVVCPYVMGQDTITQVAAYASRVFGA